MAKRPRNALYLAPNAVTTAALFAGFYAILAAFENDWRLAAGCILTAAVFDSLDGRVARWMNSESVFGVEYDSLSDAVSFGVAPAVMFYLWSLHELGRFGLGIAFCFCAATILRLARFNSQVGQTDRRYFIGMPCPAAAVLAASYVANIERAEAGAAAWLTAAVCLLLSFTMVSGVRFYSFKTMNWRTRLSFRAGVMLLTGAAIVLSAVANDIMLTVLAVMSLYLLSGYALALRSFAARRRQAGGGACNSGEDKG